MGREETNNLGNLFGNQTKETMMKDTSFTVPKRSNSFKDLDLSAENAMSTGPIKQAIKNSPKREAIAKNIDNSDEFRLVYRSPKYIHRKKKKRGRTKPRNMNFHLDLDNVWLN